MGIVWLWVRGREMLVNQAIIILCRMVYFMACIFNTLAMLTTTSLLVTLIFIMSSTFIGHFHLMILVITGCSVLGISILVSITMAIAGMDQAMINTDRVVTVLRPSNILTAFLRFSKTGAGSLSMVLGAVTLIGN